MWCISCIFRVLWRYFALFHEIAVPTPLTHKVYLSPNILLTLFTWVFDCMSRLRLCSWVISIQSPWIIHGENIIPLCPTYTCDEDNSCHNELIQNTSVKTWNPNLCKWEGLKGYEDLLGDLCMLYSKIRNIYWPISVLHLIPWFISA